MENFEHGNQLAQEAAEQKISPESHPESAEKQQPTPESSRQRIAEIDGTIALGERSISETQTQLSEARAALGLPDSQEVPHSIQVTAERNANLAKEKASAEAQLSAQADPAKATVEKPPTENAPEPNGETTESGNESGATAEKVREILKRGEVGRPMSRLARILAERDEDNLTELASPNDISRLRGASRSLENLLDQKNLSLRDIEDAYGNINSVFDRMNEPAPRGSTAREDSQSLRQLSSSLRSITEINDDLSSRLGSVDGSPNRADTARLRNLLRRVNDSVDAKLVQVNRLSDAVRRYGR